MNVDSRQNSPHTGDPPVPAHFTAIRVLGRGATAVVWLARYDVTGQEVAVKVWRRPFAADEEALRFVNECHWHRALGDHPNIVGWVWASEPTAQHPWIATQVHGTSLEAWRREHADPSLEAALTIGLDLLDGLAAMHRRALVHRDVNPRNVLVDERGRAALCDLGIAMPIERLTRDHAAGTPGFVAPELAEGGPDEVTPSFVTDVYSAARTIADLVGDAAPFAVDHLVSTVAMSHRAEDRPQDAGAFARRLRQAMAAGGIPPPPPIGDRRAAADPGDGDDAGADPAQTAPGGATAPHVHRFTLSDSFEQPPPPRRHKRPSTALPLVAGLLAGVVVGGGAVWAWQQSRPDGRPAAPPAAADVVAATPDIDDKGRPVARPARGGGPCTGPVASETSTNVTDRSGRVFGRVDVQLDREGQACATFAKDPGNPLYRKRTHLALTLCNQRRECDHDWNRYLLEAGPVRVPDASGCLHWRVSASDAAGTTWLVRDVTRTVECAGPSAG